MDVQTNQRDAVANTILTKGLDVINNIPIVTMRMHQIKDELVNNLRKDSISKRRNRWILNHEFRVTYRDELIPSEELLEGTWSKEVKQGEPILISVADNIARDANLKIGDQVVFNIQGVLMKTIVGNIRKVDWGRAQLNFSIVFPIGVLENAPQFSVLTTFVPDEVSSADLQRDLVCLLYTSPSPRD